MIGTKLGKVFELRQESQKINKVFTEHLFELAVSRLFLGLDRIDGDAKGFGNLVIRLVVQSKEDDFAHLRGKRMDCLAQQAEGFLVSDFMQAGQVYRLFFVHGDVSVHDLLPPQPIYGKVACGEVNKRTGFLKNIEILAVLVKADKSVLGNVLCHIAIIDYLAGKTPDCLKVRLKEILVFSVAF